MGASRTAIPKSQRAALRQYYQITNPKPSHSALQTWFKARFGHEISQSIVSRSLSDSFLHLDVLVSGPDFRMRSRQWPWIDLLLFDWLDAVEVQSGKVSNDMIKCKARQIWNDSNKTQGLPMPKFSSGWVTKFRRRYEMRHCHRLGQHLAPATLVHQTSLPSASHYGQLLTQVHEILPTQSQVTTRNTHPHGTSPNWEFSISTTFTFSSDHLIHLVQYNVFRGLISNKFLLRSAATFVKVPYHATLRNESAARLCGGLSVVRPLADHSMPASLLPTLEQMNCVHSSWIDMFPFPKFRDNLIKQGAEFVLEEMRQDLLGDIFPDPFPQYQIAGESVLSSSMPTIPAFPGVRSDMEFGDSDDYTAGRKGLIIWGDPWNIESWEVTPSFWKKWAWALAGCDDLIQASNRWRALRNEELMIC